jgi:hypothetical protein
MPLRTGADTVAAFGATGASSSSVSGTTFESLDSACSSVAAAARAEGAAARHTSGARLANPARRAAGCCAPARCNTSGRPCMASERVLSGTRKGDGDAGKENLCG